MEFITTVLSLTWTLLFTKEFLWLVIGLLIGWNVIPQPQWVRNLLIKFFSLFMRK